MLKLLLFDVCQNCCQIWKMWENCCQICFCMTFCQNCCANFCCAMFVKIVVKVVKFVISKMLSKLIVLKTRLSTLFVKIITIIVCWNWIQDCCKNCFRWKWMLKMIFLPIFWSILTELKILWLVLIML